MYIKWLEIYGFKSFCEKTRIEFEKGITAIVGPNGCGKSNITDAIRWALGEQSLKVLRAGKIEDLIFAGTEKRRSQGFAEVSVCFDNSDGLLPIDFEEVVITRRLFRSGESEFFINKTACRLKDIYELFLDSGLGRDGYSVISQGRVDEIINARPFERYKIFEEACGITKYKYRKEEAERKLKNTHENILRLQDVIFELKSQLEEISPEVEKAKEYINLNKKLLDLKREKYLYNYKLANENYTSVKKELEKLQTELKKLENDKHEVEGKLNEYKSRLDLLSERLESAKGIFGSLKSELAEDVSKLKFLKKQLESKYQIVESILGELAEIDEESKSTEEILLDLKERLSQKDTVYSGVTKKQEEILRELEDVENSIFKIENEIQSKEAELIEKISQIEKNTQKLNGILHLEGALLERKNRIDDEEKEIIAEQNTLDKSDAEKKAQKAKVEAEKEKLSRELDRIKASIEKKEKELLDLKDRQSIILREIINKQEKLNVLKAMEENLEGYSKTIKEVFRRVKNLPVNLYGTVGSLINVKRQYVRAVEAALGSAIQHLVVKNEDDAKTIIKIAKDEKLGKVTIVPVETVAILSSKEEIKAEGFLGFADEFIETKEEFRKVIELLSGRTLVFDTIDSAIEYQRLALYRARCVTLSGELINPGGIFVGGERKTDFSLLERKAEINELESEVLNLAHELDRFEKEISEKSQAQQILIQEKEKKESIIKEIISKIDSINKDIDMCEYKKQQLNQKKISLENERRVINDQIESLHTDVEHTRINLQKLEDSKSELEKVISELKSNIKLLKEKHNMLDGEYRKVLEEKNQIEAEISILRHKIETAQQTLKNLSDQKAKKDQQKIKCEEEIKDLQRQIDEVSSEIEEKKQLIDRQKDEIERLEKEFLEVSDIHTQNAQVLSKISEDIQTGQQSLSNLLIEKNNLENQIETVSEKYFNLFSEKIYLPDEKIVWSEEKEEEIESLSLAIGQLGDVNLYSIEQEKRLNERVEFLQRQIEDLEKTSRELKNLIDDLDRNMKNIFLENFEKIKIIFSQTFKELFNGGSCDLKLIQSSEEYGIDIDVKPPGKKLQNISLLSGGEKALTAIALLFAFLIFKGSLLCILDEIDSSLDEANVQRFAQFIKNLNNQSQIIIVTHRKPTMEIADILYGVTMEEQGVSKVLSLKLENV
ncbi:chromosome segregation protein SMC [Caldicellulosiruptor morganii]|uniref:Chromosome partition protein Smc n=1 Tax=Caldicellulosiruptor morganii TaxID=1387555 RepID=A0ABY7BMG7_9FIRM|nr:chromosome segregation protein SMC [Caldicellulosiruptor morganii]WAM33077.1 chromosome segregation protein SMC [Caldicellulosiruptor morganii]